ncbi:Flp family type IVb pilin [Nocardioides sp. MH1]|uniref:Flp family type IVb pilin n=1 Tax=Nocardioides sp. MH1 TaxID=3242490 RepID=UPI0035204866
MRTQAQCRPDHERGATAVEYALFVALIAGVIVTTILALGPIVAGLYTAASQGW